MQTCLCDKLRVVGSGIYLTVCLIEYQTVTQRRQPFTLSLIPRSHCAMEFLPWIVLGDDNSMGP